MNLNTIIMINANTFVAKINSSSQQNNLNRKKQSIVADFNHAKVQETF